MVSECYKYLHYKVLNQMYLILLHIWIKEKILKIMKKKTTKPALKNLMKNQHNIMNLEEIHFNSKKIADNMEPIIKVAYMEIHFIKKRKMLMKEIKKWKKSFLLKVKIKNKSKKCKPKNKENK